MVVSATNNQTLVFFNQTTTSPPNYVLAYQKYVSYYGVHGLTPYNDTTFYATSWLNNAVYRYTAAQNSLIWNETAGRRWRQSLQYE